MLNFFLVLGLIPGTNIQITFNEILIVFLLFVAGLYHYARKDRRVYIRQEVVQLSRLHSFSFPIPTTRQEEETDRKAEAPLKDIVSQYLSRVAQLIRRAA